MQTGSPTASPPNPTNPDSSAHYSWTSFGQMSQIIPEFALDPPTQSVTIRFPRTDESVATEMNRRDALGLSSKPSRDSLEQISQTRTEYPFTSLRDQPTTHTIERHLGPPGDTTLTTASSWRAGVTSQAVFVVQSALPG